MQKKTTQKIIQIDLDKVEELASEGFKTTNKRE